MDCLRCKNVMTHTGEVHAESGDPLVVMCTAQTYLCPICGKREQEAVFSIGNWVLDGRGEG